MSDDSDDSLPPFLTLGPAPAARPFRLAMIQLSNISTDKQHNLQRARDYIRRAAISEDGSKLADFVVLPECFNCPYNINDFPQYAEEIEYNDARGPGEHYDVRQSKSQTVRELSEAARESGIWVLGGSMPERVDPNIFNTSTIFNPLGELVAIHRKVFFIEAHDPRNVVPMEDRDMTSSRSITHVDTDFGRVGFGFCWDVRWPEPVFIAEHQECVLIVYPGAYSFQMGAVTWAALQRQRAAQCGIYIAMCSPAREVQGSERVLRSWGHSCVVDPFGRLVVDSEELEGIVYASIDPSLVDQARVRIAQNARVHT